MVQEDQAQNAAGAHEERLKGLPASAALPSEVDDHDDDDLGEEFYNQITSYITCIVTCIIHQTTVELTLMLVYDSIVTLM